MEEKLHKRAAQFAKDLVVREDRLCDAEREIKKSLEALSILGDELDFSNMAVSETAIETFRYNHHSMTVLFDIIRDCLTNANAIIGEVCE